MKIPPSEGNANYPETNYTEVQPPHTSLQMTIMMTLSVGFCWLLQGHLCDMRCILHSNESVGLPYHVGDSDRADATFSQVSFFWFLFSFSLLLNEYMSHSSLANALEKVDIAKIAGSECLAVFGDVRAALVLLYPINVGSYTVHERNIKQFYDFSSSVFERDNTEHEKQMEKSRTQILKP